MDGSGAGGGAQGCGPDGTEPSGRGGGGERWEISRRGMAPAGGVAARGGGGDGSGAGGAWERMPGGGDGLCDAGAMLDGGKDPGVHGRADRGGGFPGGLRLCRSESVARGRGGWHFGKGGDRGAGGGFGKGMRGNAPTLREGAADGLAVGDLEVRDVAGRADHEAGGRRAVVERRGIARGCATATGGGGCDPDQRRDGAPRQAGPDHPRAGTAGGTRAALAGGSHGQAEIHAGRRAAFHRRVEGQDVGPQRRLGGNTARTRGRARRPFRDDRGGRETLRRDVRRRAGGRGGDLPCARSLRWRHAPGTGGWFPGIREAAGGDVEKLRRGSEDAGVDRQMS